MRLLTGAAAPLFEAQDLWGRPVDLQGRLTLLSFFRNGACALCNLQVHRLIERYPDYRRRGLSVVAVFESPRESVVQHVGKQDVPFPIIADPKAQLYDLYGVETSQEKATAPLTAKQSEEVQEAAAIGYPLTPEEGSNFFRMPADFLIGPDLTLLRVFYSDVVGDHLSFEEIDQVLAQFAAIR